MLFRSDFGHEQGQLIRMTPYGVVAGASDRRSVGERLTTETPRVMGRGFESIDMHGEFHGVAAQGTRHAQNPFAHEFVDPLMKSDFPRHFHQGLTVAPEELDHARIPGRGRFSNVSIAKAITDPVEMVSSP